MIGNQLSLKGTDSAPSSCRSHFVQKAQRNAGPFIQKVEGRDGLCIS